MAIRISGMISGLDTDSIVKELVSAYSTKKDNYEKAQTKLSWKQDAWKEMNTKIYSFYSKSLSDMRYASSFSAMKKTSVSDETKATVTTSSGVTNGTQGLEINQLATAGYLTGAKIDSATAISNTTKLSSLGVTPGTISVNVSGVNKNINVTEDMTVSGLVTEFKNLGLKASFDTTQQRFFINSAKSGLSSDFTVTANTQAEANNLKALGLLAGSVDLIKSEALNLAGEDYTGDWSLLTEEDKEVYWNSLSQEQRDTYSKEANTKFATKQAASNAIIELNGAVFESESNTISVNGLTINAKGVTNGALSITTETDVDGIYNMIKSFITEYNTLINGMDTAFNSVSSKGFEPLTSDEKEDMSESEIEKWETKIKDSLLRRDTTLDSISTSLKSSMQSVYKIGENNYSLSSFGINTLGYFVASGNEKNAYHIDGNSEDSSVSSNKDKLKAAIIDNPDMVMDFFNKLAKDVYSDLGNQMKATSLRSTFTVYNDKQMKSEYDDYTEKIKKQEEKLKDIEDYYYKKFSEMETALSKLESSTSSLSSLLGTN